MVYQLKRKNNIQTNRYVFLTSFVYKNITLVYIKNLLSLIVYFRFYNHEKTIMEYKLMNIVTISFFIIIFGNNGYAQIEIKSEYITSSKFKDADGNKLGGKGDLKTIDGSVQIPISIKMNENNKPKAWAVALSGTYASLGNENLAKSYSESEILNAQVGLIHIRPLNDKWSMMALLGVGIFTSDLDKISGKAILGQGGVLFIRHAKQNLDWGVGVALNNALGYPMIFPSFYLDWRLDGKYQFNLSMYNSFKVGVATQFNDKFKLGLIGEFKGLMSAVNKDGKDMYFVTQYGYLGLQPEFLLGKSLSIPITIGVSMSREVYYKDRTIKAFFDDDKSISYDNNGFNKIESDKRPSFGVSAYGSIGLKYKFQR